MKSLVVEDELSSRLILQIFLSHYGDCHIAVSGEEAVAAFRLSLQDAAPYDLICMDIQMPGMGGIEAVRQIREIETADGVPSSNGVKILMASAIDDPREVMRSFNALCDDYFLKPLDASKLLDKLRGMELIA
jgi:two-component system chemotaxis response regulator CheY